MEADGEQVSSPKTVTAAPLTAVIAGRVRQLREQAAMRGSGLAAKLNDLGVPWNRTTIAKFETGQRASISVQELLALAVALDVPPVALLADPRGTRTVPVGDGLELPAWEALLWMIGSGRLGEVASHPQSSETLDLIWHGRVVAEAAGVILRTPVWMIDRFQEYPPGMQLRIAGVPGDDPQAQHRAVDELHLQQLETIREAMERIAELGAPVPQLVPKVLQRAVELDVKLPGQAGEG